MAGCNVAQGAVVHIQGARPGDLRRIEIQCVPVKDVGIHHGGQQVVRGGDGVKVAVEVQVDFLARFHLRKAAARAAALKAEDRPQRGLARSDDGFAADARQALGQPDGDHGLAFAFDGRCGGRYQYEFAADGTARIGKQTERELGAIGADGFILRRRKRQLARDFLNGQHRFLLIVLHYISSRHATTVTHEPAEAVEQEE
jgi:hypothetical protein